MELKFFSFRKLQYARNRLHLHLFFSFFLKATMFVVKEFLFYDGTALPNDIVFSPEGTYVKEHIVSTNAKRYTNTIDIFFFSSGFVKHSQVLDCT